MSWTIEFDRRVEKDLRALGKPSASRILKYLSERIAPLDDPRSLGKSLTGELGEYWHYRVGPYRIIASIEDERLRVLVVRVAHRNAVYRQGLWPRHDRPSRRRPRVLACLVGAIGVMFRHRLNIGRGRTP